jgi:hypothetical protein
MITLQALYDLNSDAGMISRITAATWTVCKDIFTEDQSLSTHQQRLTWAVKILKDDGTDKKVSQVIKAVITLLAYEYSTVTEIQAVDDSEIKITVEKVIEHLARIDI